MSKKIMFLGTGSSVGKSLLTAAFCRVLSDKGLKVAPFKSQNMSLNSYITADGKEMGRAQVTQSECARIEPRAEMNPVLLKPNSDTGSQVILNGVPEFNMDAREFHAYKAKLKDVVVNAFQNLEKEFDYIIMEGAGSPAEINLRENDLVNMGMAEMVDSPVILIGDIDKGGVFASLYGTVKLLEPEEQARIKGFIINKFRGDVTLLEPGIDTIVEKLGIPCLGVMPYTRLVIDDEDSVTDRWTEKPEGAITVGVVRLRHISNFTDCTVFDMYPDISVEYYENQRQMAYANPDLLVIPGSKNTIDDVKVLRESKMEGEILRLHKSGVPIVGICGGYQILGNTIEDPTGVESNLKEIDGLGLLDIQTVLGDEKVTTRRAGEILHDVMGIDTASVAVEGYEIHMGTTTLGEKAKPFSRLEDGREDGAISENGNVMGTYLHGIFDNDIFREKLIRHIREKKNLEDNVAFDYKAFKESQYDQLAQAFVAHIDVDTLIQMMEG